MVLAHINRKSRVCGFGAAGSRTQRVSPGCLPVLLSFTSSLPPECSTSMVPLSTTQRKCAFLPHGSRFQGLTFISSDGPSGPSVQLEPVILAGKRGD